MTRFKTGTQRLTAFGLSLLLSGMGASALAAGAPVSKGEAAVIAKQEYPGKVVSETLSKKDNGSSVYMVKVKGSQGTRSIAVSADTGGVISGGSGGPQAPGSYTP